MVDREWGDKIIEKAVYACRHVARVRLAFLASRRRSS